MDPTEAVEDKAEVIEDSNKRKADEGKEDDEPVLFLEPIPDYIETPSENIADRAKYIPLRLSLVIFSSF
jgi:hypothetical protein